MTALTVCQGVASVVGIEIPSAVMASTETEHIQLADLLTECGRRMLDAHDWQLLKRSKTLTGDGSTTAFDLPSDYHRMPKDGRLWSSRLDGPLWHVFSHDEWLELEVRSYEFVAGAWTILGGQIHVKPAMASDETAQFYYQSNLLWNDGSSNAAEPMADTDTFRLDERLLRLAMIWAWKHHKGLPYAEDMQTYEIALAQAVGRDYGPRALRAGRRRRHEGVSLSYPQEISG